MNINIRKYQMKLFFFYIIIKQIIINLIKKLINYLNSLYNRIKNEISISS